VNFYSSVLFVHVGAATVLVSSSIAAPFIVGAMRRAGSVGEIATWLDHERRMVRANPAAALVLLLSGAYLTSAGWWGSGWLAVSMALFVLNAAYAARVVAAESQRIGRAAEMTPEGPVPPALDAVRWSERLDWGADILLGADVAAMFIMINKPTPLVSIVVATLGVGSALVRRTLRRRSKAPALVDSEPVSVRHV